VAVLEATTGRAEVMVATPAGIETNLAARVVMVEVMLAMVAIGMAASERAPLLIMVTASAQVLSELQVQLEIQIDH